MIKADVAKLAAQSFSTPFYLFDEDVLKAQIERIRSHFKNEVKLCYAIKANPFIVKAVEPWIDYFEVCSKGEFNICERAEINMKKVILSGVQKNADDIDYAVKTYGADIIYTAESALHLENLTKAAEKHKTVINVLPRITCGNQFGMDFQVAEELLKNLSSKYINFEGLHYFAGTQKKSAGKFKKELGKLIEFANRLKSEYSLSCSRLEYGPGLPITYFKGEEDLGDNLLNDLSNEINSLDFAGTVTPEMGRFIAADCGAYFTSVTELKNNCNQNYCLVDGGIHHMNYYGQMLAMKQPYIDHLGSNQGEEEEWTICGILCTSNDVLVKNYPFKGLNVGDCLVFQKAGAYSMTEGISLLLSHPLPQVVLYSEKKSFNKVRDFIPTDKWND